MYQDVPKQIRTLRDSKNMSQERFGKKLGLSGKTISSYETGRSMPPLRVLETISDAYDVTIAGINSKKKNQAEKTMELIQKGLKELQRILETT